MVAKKQHLQEFLSTDNVQVTRPKRQLFRGDRDKTEAQTKSMSYTFCWDNTQIEVRARHQLKEKNVWQMIWALCYAATNRVETKCLPDDVPTTKAKEIQVEAFLPSPKHTDELREWLAFHVKQSLIGHLPTFHKLSMPKFIYHQYSHEMSQQSEIINLGVIDENPSTTDGAIGISDFLTSFVPCHPDGRPFTIITHCDGGAFERMVGVRKVRAPDRGPMRQLLGLEPSAQEFHKRGLMLQLIMDRYFKGGSQSERGTLSNIKVVMSQHSVKAKVMDSFNHVEDMFDMTCDGYICLLAMHILGMEDYDEILPFIKSKQEKERILDETVDRIVDLVWLHPTDNAVCEVADAVVPPTSRFDSICCGQDVTGDVILCSNPKCPSGGHFHAQCIELITGETPPSDEDWWCSPGCEPWSRFCRCKTFVGGSTMVECQRRKQCQHGQWFHLLCVGLDRKPRKDEMWHCPGCKSKDQDDSVYQYSVGLTWMLLNDRLRRHAIRTGNGRMMLEFWKDDGIHFWNEGHNTYLILMHRMIADNLKKTHGKYTAAQIARSSFLTESVAKDLDRTFARNVADSSLRDVSHGQRKARSSVVAFLQEYRTDELFAKIPGRQHSHFADFSAMECHQEIKKPGQFKARLLKYSRNLDRERYAAYGQNNAV